MGQKGRMGQMGQNKVFHYPLYACEHMGQKGKNIVFRYPLQVYRQMGRKFVVA